MIKPIDVIAEMQERIDDAPTRVPIEDAVVLVKVSSLLRWIEEFNKFISKLKSLDSIGDEESLSHYKRMYEEAQAENQRLSQIAKY